METSKKFIVLALIMLGFGLLFGILGTFQYVLPGFLKTVFSFEKTRPLHVSSVVFWIILAAAGVVQNYLNECFKKGMKYPILTKIQYWMFLSAIPLILISYILGIFGGREYWEFHPVLALPIIIGWIAFLIYFFASVRELTKQPVYVWMWLTGIVFFLFTFLESYLWLIPYFRNNIIGDMTVQWKSYGAMVGSWNMLIYGSSIYLMDKISEDKKNSSSITAFLIYFLGLFNLMFNWGHHIYSLPTAPYIRYISYGVSMTELLLLGRMIYYWKSTLSTAKKYRHEVPYKFLLAADIWIFIMLAQAIIMSIPAFNLYTHGTHITVAHSMGTTIGINSMLLMAFVYDILGKNQLTKSRLFKIGYIMVNASLIVFWLSLMTAGILRGFWQMDHSQNAFSQMMSILAPFFISFSLSGIALAIGFYLLFRHLYLIRSKKNYIIL
ncbi:nitric oxide reductase subunit B [Flavobacterium sp. HSC-32F16]|uniref:cbb3-type cytochrome c oxidase subunit I n=1 Tax=Flavobacterium sp. HSC-32F16 TaxID=2910964 RepID=UPI0020A33DD4|nr:cbb3-type cytochrome c oxidase subunit I [Flavobacterium sp. HSC-32F16]MCP2025305.1 nitric oxide reductase subunit B [Flavobacterium sp. HSC-32F16]